MSSVDNYPAERLVPYDQSWAVRYADLARTLRTGLGRDWDLEHVGSTSVPDLSAKPVIDLAMGQPPGHDLAAAVPRLRAMGWTEPVDVGDHKAAFMLCGATRIAIAHVFTREQWPETHVRLFAEWLRSHEVDRGDYERLKRGLVADDVWGSGYTQAKTEFVVRIVNAARTRWVYRPLATSSMLNGGMSRVGHPRHSAAS